MNNRLVAANNKKEENTFYLLLSRLSFSLRTVFVFYLFTFFFIMHLNPSDGDGRLKKPSVQATHGTSHFNDSSPSLYTNVIGWQRKKKTLMSLVFFVIYRRQLIVCYVNVTDFLSLSHQAQTSIGDWISIWYCYFKRILFISRYMSKSIGNNINNWSVYKR